MTIKQGLQLLITALWVFLAWSVFVPIAEAQMTVRVDPTGSGLVTYRRSDQSFLIPHQVSASDTIRPLASSPDKITLQLEARPSLLAGSEFTAWVDETGKVISNGTSLQGVEVDFVNFSSAQVVATFDLPDGPPPPPPPPDPGPGTGTGTGTGNPGTASGGLVTCDGPDGTKCNFSTLVELIHRVIQFIFSLVTAIAAIVMVAAGFTYIFSGGNPNRRSKAKSMFTNFFVGLGIIMVAWIAIATIFRAFGVSNAYVLLNI